MASYLDPKGVQLLWERMKEYIYNCGCSECGGDVDVGYECTNEEFFNASGATEVGSGSNPPMYSLSYSDYIDADKIIVVFNGTEYVCKRRTAPNNISVSIYGASTPTFSDYPFVLASQGESGNMLFTKQPMDFTIEAFLPTATVTPCFEAAVKVVTGDSKGVKVIHIEDDEGSGFICDTSCDEILETIQNGGYAVASYYGEFYNLDTIDVDLTSETPSAPIRSKAPSLKSEGSGSTITFAKVVINTDTQQAERRGFTFDMDDCSITYFPSYA